MIDHEYILIRGTSWNSKTMNIDSDEKWYSYFVFKLLFFVFLSQVISLHALKK